MASDGTGAPHDAKALRRLIATLSAGQLAAALEGGKVDKEALENLQRMSTLLSFAEKERARRVAPGVAAVAALLLALSFLRWPTHAVTVVLSTQRAALLLAAGETATMTPFATADAIDVTPSTAALPPTCHAANAVPFFEVGKSLRIDATEPASPLSIGDTTPIRDDLNVVYRYVDARTLSIQAPSASWASVLVGVPVGSVTSRGANGAVAKCNLEDDVVRVEASSFRIVPRDAIGPLHLSKASDAIDFSERRAVGLRDVSVTTIRHGTVQFESLPGESVPLSSVSLLDIQQGGRDPITAYVQPEADGLRVTLHGEVARVTDSGRDIRPTLLREVWASPWLRLLAAVSLGFVSIVSTIRGILRGS